MKKIKTSISGIILYSFIDNDPYFIIGQGKNKKWTLPKGKAELGETILQAAIRETDEEVNIKIDNPYFVCSKVFSGKEISFFAACIGQDIKPIASKELPVVELAHQKKAKSKLPVEQWYFIERLVGHQSFILDKAKLC